MKILLAILIAITIDSLGQDSTYFRSVDPWVDTVASSSTINDTLLKNQSPVILLRLSNGKFCLINNGDKPIKIKRIDAQMDMVGSEIEINGEWKCLQWVDYSMVTCGNSYWTMNLEPKEFIQYHFYIPNASDGKVIKIRLVAEYNDTKIYSEPWIIHLYDYQIRQAGKAIK